MACCCGGSGPCAECPSIRNEIAITFKATSGIFGSAPPTGLNGTYVLNRVTTSDTSDIQQFEYSSTDTFALAQGSACLGYPCAIANNIYFVLRRKLSSTRWLQAASLTCPQHASWSNNISTVTARAGWVCSNATILTTVFDTPGFTINEHFANPDGSFGALNGAVGGGEFTIVP